MSPAPPRLSRSKIYLRVYHLEISCQRSTLEAFYEQLGSLQPVIGYLPKKLQTSLATHEHRFNSRVARGKREYVALSRNTLFHGGGVSRLSSLVSNDLVVVESVQSRALSRYWRNIDIRKHRVRRLMPLIKSLPRSRPQALDTSQEPSSLHPCMLLNTGVDIV